MNDPGPAGSPDPDDLQFDQPEYVEAPAVATTTCAGCKRPIDDAYYALNGTILCGPCCDLVQRQWAGGSGLARFAKAGLLGSLAAAVGFAIYFGVLKLTGYEVGLISILVGLIVGGAVLKGSGGRGGWAYQLLAIFLTYTAIVASYSGILLPELFAKFEADRAAKQAGAAKPGPAEVAKAAPPGRPAVAPEPVEEAEATLPLPLALLLFIGLLYAFPVIAGFHSPMSLFIIGFALWQAGKMNRRSRIEITGPYAVGEGGPGPAQVPVHA